jgi:outer membrane receptor protein involved in Fe transport
MDSHFNQVQMNAQNLLLMRLFQVTLGLLLFAIVGQAQTQVYGTVLDAETGEPLIGASVYLEEYSMGSVTDFDGRFRFSTRQTGEAHVVASMIGYTNSRNYIQLPALQGGRDIGMAAMDMGVLRLAASTIGLNEANVIASVAIDRETPVAVSTLDARTIQEQLGDKELVETLNITPGVYATKSGGGFGDSRINIRGFDQRNVAVLINGIPVNDMENGWVYWSNWAGLGDAVNTMQVQRGLGASKLAINSVGGTLNIITKATDMKKGGSLLQSVTDYGRYKSMLSLSSGVMKNGWAVSAVGSRTMGNAYVDAAFIDAWSYFLTAAKDFGAHRLVLTAIGAPQTHGQRRGQLSVDRFNDLNSLGYEAHRWNDDWGYLNRGGATEEVLNSRVNGYHKPQFALNHYWQLSERSHLASSYYVSVGQGYGSRYDGTSSPRLSETYEDADGMTRTVKTNLNWDYLWDSNENNTQPVTYAADQIGYDAFAQAWLDTVHMFGDPIVVEGDTVVGGRSRSVIENAHNEHFWTGVLSTLHHEVNDRVNLMVGVDARYYSGKHFTRVNNLLGGDFYLQSFSSSDGYGINPNYELMAQPGDKVDYDDIGLVRYAGGFAQAEYKDDRFSLFAAGTMSFTGYRRIDPYKYFRYAETGVQEVTELNEATGNIETTEQFVYGEKSLKASSIGYNAKAGGSVRLGETSHIYVNGGVYSRAPFIRYVFTNYSNVLSNDRLTNEKVAAFEAGYRFRWRGISLDVNAYHTQWRDKSIMSSPLLRPDGTEYRAFITGLIQTHEGIELELKTRPFPNLEIGGMASFGDWRWDNDVNAEITAEEGGEVLETLYIYSAGLKVSDAPQSQVGLLMNYSPTKGLRVGANYVHNWNLYARFEVDADRTNPDRAGLQPVMLPEFGYLDLRASYRFETGGLGWMASLNVQNALDNIYISDGFETFVTNPQTGVKEQGTVENGKLEGYWAYGRTFSATLKMMF